MALLGDNWVVIAIAVAAVIAVLLICLWWWVPKWQMRSVTTGDPKARADVEDNFRKTIGQAIGGLLVLIGAGAAYLQFWQQQQASRAQLQAAHDLLISNQVSKGFEQLASDKLVMRLGGIYALEGVMRTSEQYHQPVLEALCAFVRDGTKKKGTNEEKPTTDIQSALTAIGRRSPGPGWVNLTEAVLQGADLAHSDFRGANLINTNLSRADLRDADLRDAFLRGANLSSALLGDAKLSGSHVSQDQLDEACGDPVSLPQGLIMRPGNCKGGRGSVPPIAPPLNPR